MLCRVGRASRGIRCWRTRAPNWQQHPLGNGTAVTSYPPTHRLNFMSAKSSLHSSL